MLNERKLTKPELAKREDIVMDMKKNKRKLVKRYGKDAEKVMYGRATNMAKKQNENMDDKKLNLRKMIEDALQNPKAADLNKDGKLSDYEKKRGAAIEKNLKKENIGLADLEENIDKDEDIVMYDGEEHVVVRRVNTDHLDGLGPRIYIRPKEESVILGKKDTFWVKPEDLNEDLDISEEKDEMSLRNISLAELEEMGYEAGEKATYTYATIVVRLQNRPDKLAYNKGFIQGVKDELGSSLSEDLNEDLDLGHEDNEPHMLKADLYRIGKYAMELYQMMDEFEGKGEVDLPHWWQSKISNAKSSIVGAKHYLDFEIKEPQIDAMVDKIDDTSPEMEIDEGMSEKEWAEATEKANLSKLKNSDQDKIKKIVAMLKAEKKS